MTSSATQRTELLLGADAVARLRDATVLVVGLGAVGSFATEALARAGIGRLILVDFDVVAESNLNRQLFALHSTLGRPKVDVARERVLDINPAADVRPECVFAHTDNFHALFAHRPDFVVDAIDALNPKVALAQELLTRGLPHIAAMGAARRREPSRIRVADISQTEGCPLARAVRRALRRRGVQSGLRCVYSDEPVSAASTGEPEDEDPCLERNGRGRRTLGSLATLTGIFGLTAANEALRHLLAWPQP